MIAKRQKLYMICINDGLFELPVFVGTCKECAEVLGLTISAIYSRGVSDRLAPPEKSCFRIEKVEIEE